MVSSCNNLWLVINFLNIHNTVVKPAILEFPEDTHVIEGQEVEFCVRVSGSPVPKMTWYHSGEKVLADYSVDLAEDGSLSLPSAESRHGGVYQLVAENTAGRVEREVELHVTEEEEAEKCEANGSQSEMEFEAVPVTTLASHVERLYMSNSEGFKREYKVQL